MFQLIAIGPDAQQQWRRIAQASFQTRLGRETAGGWSVPWDMRISRNHADITFHDDRLEIRCLESARNPAIVDGHSARQFYIRPGQEFRIGLTVFRLEETATGERHVVESPIHGRPDPSSNRRGPGEHLPPEERNARDRLLRKIQNKNQRRDQSRVVNNLEAVLDYLNDSEEADYEPESIDDHLPLDSSSSWTGATSHHSHDAREILFKENESLQRELASSAREQKRLTAMLLQSHRDAQALRKELSAKQAEADDAERTGELQQQKQHDQFREDLASALADHQRQQRVAADKLHAAESQSAQLNQQIEQMCQERLTLLGQLDEIREHERQRRAEQSQIQSRHESELATLNQALLQQQADARAKDRSVEDAIASLNASEADNQQLRLALEELKHDLPAPNSEAMLQQLQAELAKASDIEAALRSSLDEAKSELENERELGEAWQKQLDAMKGEAEKSIREKTDSIRDADDRAMETQRIIESLQASSKAWQARAEQKAESHHQADLELRRLMSEIAASHLTTTQIKEDMQTAMARRDEEAGELHGEIASLEKRLQLNLDITNTDDLENDDPPTNELEQIKLFAVRRGRLIEWLREKLESTKSRLQREAAQRRKMMAYARRLEKDLQHAKLAQGDHRIQEE